MSRSERFKGGNDVSVFWVDCTGGDDWDTEIPFWILIFEQFDPEDVDVSTFVADVAVAVELIEEDAEIPPHTVVVGQVSTANELLFNGSSSD